MFLRVLMKMYASPMLNRTSQRYQKLLYFHVDFWYCCGYMNPKSPQRL
jgi:hypothetical protein